MKRRITLLFMSMFLVLGTSMAQDDKADPAAFELLTVSPADGAMVTTVYNIRLEFSKDVAVTLPEGGIDVVNSETKEVVKITRVYEDEWTPKNNAMLMFEQKMVPGKDGKEELQDQYIETPGAYTYTIPAGCIKSVDGEEFAERTFTFTIVGTFSYASYSPVTTDKLEKIEVAFDKEITEVKLPNSGLSIVDYYWTPVANVVNAIVSDDKKTVTLELDKAITEQGQYALDLYQGVFVSADGISQYSTLMFNVVDSNPSFSLNYEDGSRVQEIGDLEITFENVKEVKLVEGADKICVYPTTGSVIEGTATLADNKITVTFGELTEEGEYVFFIPAGMFTMDGVGNEARELTVTLSIAKITPLAIESVTPGDGEIDQIGRIVVSFNQDIQMAWDEEYNTISKVIYLTDAAGNKIALTENYNPSLSYNQLEYAPGSTYAEDGLELIVEPITAAGTYTLDLSQIVVNYGKDENWMFNAFNGFCEGTCTWTIEDDAEPSSYNVTVHGGQYGRCIWNGNVVEPETTIPFSGIVERDEAIKFYFIPFEGYQVSSMKRNGVPVAVNDNMYEETATEDVVFSDVDYITIVDTLVVTETVVDTLVIEETVVDTLVVTETVVDTLVVKETVVDTLVVTDTVVVEKVDTVVIEKVEVDTLIITEIEELPTPVITCENGVVTITCEETDVTILYAINGDPLEGSVYTAPFEVTEDAVVSAVAVRRGDKAELSVQGTGVAQSRMRVVSRRYYSENGVELTSPEDGVTIVAAEYEDGSTRVFKMVKK